MRIGILLAGSFATLVVAMNACGGGVETKDETTDAQPPPSPTFGPAPGANAEGRLPPRIAATCPDTGTTCE
jgi:hypothetical protein